MKYRFSVIVFISLLSACGSGTGSSSGGSQSPQSTNQLVAGFEALRETVDNTPFTLDDQMPTSGTATFTGYAGYGTPESDLYYVFSHADLTADFSSSTITGSLYNFRAADDAGNDVILTGVVDIGNGLIVGSDFQAELSGELGGLFDGEQVSDEVTGSINGAFSGADADLVEGSIFAVIDGTQIVGYLYAQQR